MPVPDTFLAATVNKPYAQHVVSNRSLQPLESGEVAIKITATAVNPVDWKIRDYNFFIKEYPAVLGSDAAGEIVAVGADVSNFAVGDRVFFQGIIGRYDSSTFQQYCKMPAALVSKTPSNISDDQAAGISLATVAVVTAFYDKSGQGLTPPWDPNGPQVGNGKAIVIIGGASSVGQYAIQLAKLSGFEKIVTNASAQNHEWLKKLGAHVVLDRAPSSPEDFKAAIGGLPLEFVFDAISVKETQALGVGIVQATKGADKIVTVQGADSDAIALGQSKEPKVAVKQVLGLGSSPALRYLSEPLVKHLGGEDGYIAKNVFVPNRVHLVEGGLNTVEQALAKNKEGVSGEKVVFRPNEGAN
ncbi:putative secondary metabolism biosynthetic enzyme [Aspergillus flavus]|uniref:Alcohol dehydrogenase n=1 Tax=Aspergillus flavus TaxID=5059 RepID=A0AB74CE20_ASPFL|nr:alcohol dehydrogenase [Aspergillus flavus]UDD63497.1 putative secondary metabolism biosynthetic enzyme [Aspergillus flavus]